MIIEDLKKSITEMTPQEALELTLKRRDSRTTPKKRSSSKSSKKKEPMSLEEIINTMSTEQAQEYLEKLQKVAKDGNSN